MSAITDIQRALNQIRRLERAGTEDTRTAALALMTSTAADMARELRGNTQQPKKRAAAKALPKPSAPPKPTAPPAPEPAKTTARPFTEPELPQETVETLRALSNIEADKH